MSDGYIGKSDWSFRNDAATSHPPRCASKRLLSLNSVCFAMASEILTPEESPRNVSSPSHARSPQHYPAKPQRVLACILCQQRKIKCDRKSPCAGCTKAGAQCIPASLVPRQRRRRFPERELLDRLRHYEELLRQHQIGFEPLHPGRAIDGSAFATTRASSDKERMQEAASDLELNTDESMTFRTK
jgi:hypothetical protein